MMVSVLLLSFLAVPADDAELTSIFYELFRAAQVGDRDVERAAFLTRDCKGGIERVMWPATMQRRAETYRGPLPPNVIAIAHTHPDGLPQPSRQDIAESKRVGLPIYVVSRTAIARVDPSGETTEIVRNRNWFRSLQR